MNIEEQIPLAEMTTLGVGGPAKYFSEVRNVDELKATLTWAEHHQEPIFVLGGGSNIVISEKGFDGLVIRLGMKSVSTLVADHSVKIRCEAGLEWDKLVEYSVTKNWSGMECLSGIPGSVGATPIQNVGAYGQEVADTIIEVEVLNIKTKKLEFFSNQECQFSYRDSRFKSKDTGKYVVVAVCFELTPNRFPELRYGELSRLARSKQIHTVNQLRETVLEIRRSKGMVVDPDDPDSKSAGSFFTNPILSLDHYKEFSRRLTHLGMKTDVVPIFPTADGRKKVSAAWLIEHSGFKRGHDGGSVGLSSKHALALINKGGARSDDVLDLCMKIKGAVFEHFGLHLEPEPQFVGG